MDPDANEEDLWLTRKGQKARNFFAHAGFALSAYAPLALMMGAIYLPISWKTAVIWVGVSLLLASTLSALISRRARRIGARPVSYSNAREQGDAVAGYVAVYFIPFLILPSSSWGVAIAYVIFFLIILFLHSISRLGLINPTLYLLRWRVSQVEISDRVVFLLHKGVLPVSGKLDAVEFSGIYIEKKKR